MKIGLFSTAGDKQTRRLLSALNSLSPGSALLFDLALEAPERSAMSAGEAVWNGVDLAELDTAFLRGFQYCDPVVPSGNLDVDWSLWRYDYIALQQRYTYLYSLFCELERRGVRVVNSPDAHLRLFMKPFILEHLRLSGLKVPALVCTNSMEAARAFCGSHAKVVWRPATGRAAWQLFLHRQREALISLRKPPVLLAEAVEGPLRLGYLYEGQPLLLLKMSAPEAAEAAGEETLEGFCETDCPEAAADLRLLAETAGTPWLRVAFVLKDDRAWIYDLEADPLFEDLPAVHGEKLVVRLAERLLRQELAAQPVSAAPEPKERPAIFLRRMLEILFEFEQSKYK